MTCPKASYSSKRLANQIRNRRARGRSRQRRPKELRVYYCWFCNGWHLTSQGRA